MLTAVFVHLWLVTIEILHLDKYINLSAVMPSAIDNHYLSCILTSHHFLHLSLLKHTTTLINGFLNLDKVWIQQRSIWPFCDIMFFSDLIFFSFSSRKIVSSWHLNLSACNWIFGLYWELLSENKDIFKSIQLLWPAINKISFYADL